MEKKDSIKRALFQKIFITTFAVTLFFCLINYFYVYQNENKKLNLKAEQSINKFVELLKIPLWNFNTQLLEKFSQLLMNEKQVCSVKIVDDTGNILVSFADKECVNSSKNNLLKLEKKVYYKKFYLGKVSIVLSRAHVINQLFKLTLSNFLLFLSLLLILLLVTHYNISNYVLAPLNVFDEYVRNISKGDYDVTIKEKFNWEFEKIKEAFNQMVVSIKKYNNELIEANQKISTLLDTMPDAVFILNKKGKIIEVNKTSEIMFGYLEQEFRKIDTGKLFGAEFERKLKLKKILKPNNDYVYEFESEGEHKDGSKIPLSIRIKSIELNNIQFAMMIVTDVSKSKAAEKTIISEKERLNVTLRSITDGVIVTNEKGNIVMFNNAAQLIFNIDEKDALSKPVTEILDFVDDKNGGGKHIILQVIDTHTSVSFDGKIKINDNEIDIEGTCSPIMYHSEFLGIIIIIKDVTEKGRMEMKIIRAQKLESVGLLAGGIAHDFNNLLSSIILYNLLIREHTGNKKVISYTKDIEKMVDRAKGLTEQLLTFSKGGSPIKNSFNIGEIIEETVKFITRGTAIKVELQKSDELWPALVNREQISQVIHNLVLNAKQALNDKGIIKIGINNVILSKENEYSLPQGKYIRIDVQDNGPGIPDNILGKIFDPFFTTKEKGSGLGLSIVHSIIKKHNGYIEAVKLEIGMKFTILLPASSEKQKKYDYDKEVLKEKFDLKLKILVLDDDETIRNSLTELLKLLGHNVESVGDGIFAIEKYKKAMEDNEPFDLLILDLTVPGGMGGKEALERILTFDPDVKAVISSGYSDNEIMSKYDEYGFKGVIKKPFRMEDIEKILIKLFINKI
jgi:PAS domain S-box-containing protein